MRLFEYEAREVVKRAGIPVSMCGEMASDPIYAIVLLGLGLEIFSMNPSSIPIIKNVVRSVRYKDCRRIAEAALQKKTAQEIEEFIIESVAMKACSTSSDSLREARTKGPTPCAVVYTAISDRSRVSPGRMEISQRNSVPISNVSE